VLKLEENRCAISVCVKKRRTVLLQACVAPEGEPCVNKRVKVSKGSLIEVKRVLVIEESALQQACVIPQGEPCPKKRVSGA